ncbi:heterogeneous nuclear ribonucleoprotein 1 isoform X1 [Cajanus cajan]|uniref:RNA-binding protein C660.15 family n=1 Tax=Cajanus cajan TaxID=3821 RepID=A0A151SUD9_CAJCA|nr:heterogeneous nuclear ribonucleoprotein 1 isoform X1 [Cajanus cajan]KYP58391.1 putative RNA-binding protein C660.15 family [Cajanus cajan]
MDNYYLSQHSQFESETDAYNADVNGDHAKPSFNRRDSSSGKLFVGGISWETSQESFFNYFSKYGEVTDSVIMTNKLSGRPRGFGFVTFADSAVADEVLAQEHTIDGRVVEVKRTVPREDMEVIGVLKTKKIFVGGIPQFFADDDLKEYFSPYGDVIDCQIMLDHNSGRSRGFGFVTFDNEDSVDKVFSVGKIHEIGGKQVEIKRAEPKRSAVDNSSNTSRKSYGGFGNGMDGYGGNSSRNRNHGKRGGQYSDSGMNGAYNHFEGSFNGNAATVYGGYCGYGYGFGYGGPMYCFGGYGVNSYGNPMGYGGIASYGDGNAYGRTGNFNRTGGYDSGKVAEKDDGPTSGRYHPYWK